MKASVFMSVCACLGAAVLIATGPGPIYAAPHHSMARTHVAASGISSKLWGAVDGKNIYLYTLTNRKGAMVKITNYGGRITNIIVPDRHGKMGDIVLGFDNLKGYVGPNPYFGATVGRYANRIGHAEFRLDGRTYHLPANDGKNTLHGGFHGFDRKVWTATRMRSFLGPSLRIRYVSKDGEEGFPGALTSTVTFTLMNGSNDLKIDYRATTTRPTIVNLTNHSYFNLCGKGNVLGTLVMINSSKYTPVDKGLIPTGKIVPVQGTPYDFRKPTTIGARIDQIQGNPGGYDMNWVLYPHHGMTLAAQAYAPACGRVLSVYTDQPGLQFYSGNFLDGSNIGKNGEAYHKHYAFCMETQHYPDSINHPNFPSVVLRPGQVYHTDTIFKFSTR